MKKIIHPLLLLILLASLFSALPVGAMGDLNTSMQGSELPNVFLLSQLGYAETIMTGPYDLSNVFFSLPPNIRLAPGSSFTLRYALSWSGASSGDAELPGYGGTLLVYFNDELIDTILLTPDSPLEKEILIPDSALNTVDEGGRHNLRLFLNADLNCEADTGRTTVIVDENSLLSFQYEVVPPVADLTLFPRPIYQTESILPSSALMVVPPNPEAFELQAAIASMTGIGEDTGGGLNIRLVTSNELSQDLVASNHLIFVGLAGKFPNLEAVNLPLPVANGRLQIGQEFDSDGVIQIGLSPWSPAHVVMFVGGNSQDAVIKAGQAFSTGNFIAVEKPGLSVIKNVNPLASAPSQENQTLGDLGYEDQNLGIYGENYAEYIFYATSEQAASEGAYLDLILSHSDLIDYEQTGITVILNDQVIGALKLSEESPATERIKLVPGILRRGFNRLEVVSEILPYFSCYAEDLLSTSVTLSNTSTIHLPVSITQLDFSRNVNLRDFPYMFLDSRDLGNLAFVLAPNDPVSWNYASLVAYNIGAIGGVPLANVHAMYADNVDEESLKNYSLLIFGLPNAVPFYAKINDVLPAPFNPETNEAVQPSMLVNYSLLPDTSVGYLQLIASPWNSERTILVVSGNTIEGLPMAGSALLRDDQIAKLIGNFAIVYFDQIVSTDTRLGIPKESIVSQLPVAVTVTPDASVSLPQFSNPPIESHHEWILPLVAVVTVFILVLLVIMLRRESAARKKPKESRARDEASTESHVKNS